MLRDVDSTGYGGDATALSWDLSALSGAAHAVIDKIGGQGTPRADHRGGRGGN